MMKKDSWGDTNMLNTLSLIWQAKITVVNISGEDLWENRFRHNEFLHNCDFVLISNARNHFNAGGMYSRPDFLYIRPIKSNSRPYFGNIRPILFQSRTQERCHCSICVSHMRHIQDSTGMPTAGIKMMICLQRLLLCTE